MTSQLVMDEAGSLPATPQEAPSDAAAAQLRADAARGEQEWRRKLEALQERVGRYYGLVGRLGARGARRKAGVSHQDLQMWALVTQRHKASIEVAKLRALGEAAGKGAEIVEEMVSATEQDKA